MKRQRKGFTLVELAIVIAILGILAVVAIPKYEDMVSDARSAQARAQLGTVRSAIAIYYAKHQGTFPTTIDASLFADGNIASVDIGSGSVSTVVVVTSIPSPVTGTGGWLYQYNSPAIAGTGRVVINSAANDPASSPAAAWSTY
ncbi:MAG: prepilin-type N-terminal cleavage/methylation domain-containing protein [Caldisericia bacterium]